MNDQIRRERLYKEAFALLERANRLIFDARAKHEQMAAERKAA